ncbi:hemerythrin-like metal-binding protein [Desulfobaculum xiamenense]|uniref:Hemerythrin-like metal-binding protein n=1 Tax=Desulfobaculum xiamenense TaxID=995050 RepID=A0A846QKK1_9BACT|nr:bacteriohemerythrin [Desulfobaculum xiamenense]NJB68718.1 hemerythrin-like metal-binding protein [Desulfobaculum xiamenense]
MSRIEFTDDMRLGIDDIDEQHEKLIDLINELYEAIMDGSDADVIDEIVDEAHDYIGYHFSTEQDLMERYEYPEIDEHTDEHDDYILRSSEHLVDAGDNREGLAGDVLEFLTDWWVTHIGDTDRRLVEFLKKKGVA